MRVLLDHNLPHKLRTNLGTPGKHEFVTASYMQWGGLKNGELLRAARQFPFRAAAPRLRQARAVTVFEIALASVFL